MNTQTQNIPVPEHYTRTAVALHWLVAGFIVCGFVLGWVMTDLAVSPLKLRMYNWHKWVGITVLGLAALRGIWRLTHRAPALLPMPAWQKLSAQVLHVALYVLMFLQPISGWIYSNAAGYPVVYLGLIPLPNLVGKDKALAKVMEERHELLGWVLLSIFVLHALAALKHHFVDRDDTLRRMLSWRASN
jgi:cytochrome b561